jgi:CubicO group peptidase (beta-lactamase class C family)
MKRTSWKAIIVSLLLASLCHAQDLTARMEHVVQHFIPADGPPRFMGSVLVARGDEVLFSKGYGFANMEWKIPDSPSTKFRLGSVTKQFTAASILLLEERGKLKTDDPVKKYMPDAPAAWDSMTIFNVLTHTAGIPSFTEFPDYGPTEGLPTTPEKLVARFRDKPLEFQPGEKWKYSNSGYVLLGYLIEKITGSTYQKFLQDNIFTPLNMKDSGYDSNSAIIANRANGYTPGRGGIVNASYVHMSIPFSAGALYSTTEDLLRWEQGLFGGKVLSAASLGKMTTPFKNDYACGLTVHAAGGHKVIEHGGSINGFNTSVAYYPDEKLTVVVLSNLNGPTPGEMSPKLAAAARGEAVLFPSERKEITVAPKILSDYAGTYELRPGFNIVMTVEDGRLMTQATGQPKNPLFAESQTKFFLKVVDAEVEFVKDASGKVTHMVLYQGGRETKGQRQ